MVTLRSLRGANFWSPRPVTRIDLAVGAYDEISSAEVPGVTEALLAALPGLIEHRCSIGERGGFVTRLRRGTYIPHILEHVGLELQVAIGHDVGYGRARGGDREGEYTVVFEHLHAEVGLRAAALGLELTLRAFSGTLETAEYALHELRSLTDSPDVPALEQRVLCGITGGGPRSAVRDEMARRGLTEDELVVDVAPGYLLNAGLPYSRSEVAVVLDAQPTDVPERYRESDRAQRLVGVLADAVPRNGIVVVPAKEWEVQDIARDGKCRVGIFAAEGEVTARDAKVAYAVAIVRDGRIAVEWCGEARDGGAVHGEAPVEAQLAATLAMMALEEKQAATRGRDAGVAQRV